MLGLLVRAIRAIAGVFARGEMCTCCKGVNGTIMITKQSRWRNQGEYYYVLEDSIPYGVW